MGSGSASREKHAPRAAGEWVRHRLEERVARAPRCRRAKRLVVYRPVQFARLELDWSPSLDSPFISCAAVGPILPVVCGERAEE